MDALTKSRLLEACADAVRTVEHVSLSVTDWGRSTPCEQWDAQQLAGHLLCIVGHFHTLLDAALDGTPREDLPTGAELAELNSRMLDDLPPTSGPERIQAFARSGRLYVRRLVGADWSRPLGHWDGLGELSILDHARLALREWHVHAWDLAQSQDDWHAPPLTSPLFDSSVPSLATAVSWETLLSRAGRVWQHTSLLRPAAG